jgi:hypothetical protein
VLDHSAVVDYVLGQQLLRPATVVEGDVIVRELSSRNRNFAVHVTGGRSLFLKQGAGPLGVASVAYEAFVYQRLAESEVLRKYTPELIKYDPDEGVLTLEYLSNGRDFRSHHLRIGRFPATIAARSGEAIAGVHRATTVQSFRIGPPPWILRIHRPDLNIFRDASAASLELIKIVQSAPGFSERLDELVIMWQPETLIHQDLRWDNLIVERKTGSRTRTSLRIIDWETACVGDPCWDVGSLFAQYLSWWLSSIPITGQDPPERFPELARYPLTSMQPAIRACWSAYERTAHLDSAKSMKWLMRAVSFAAARLLFTAFEATQMAPALDSRVVLHLQLALNILSRPTEAAVHLLGLDCTPG